MWPTEKIARRNSTSGIAGLEDSSSEIDRMSEDRDLDLIYIGGYGRSGSTLLLRLLCSLDGHVPVGELRTIWTHYCQKNRMCGCGKTFRDCEFWSAVMHDAFGGVDHADADHMADLQKSTIEGHAALLALRRLRSPSYERHLREYTDVMSGLYRSIQKVSSCDIIVDSSKRPAHAFVCSAIPRVRSKLLHLVRDSRACAYSWQRRKRRPEFPDRPVYMYRFNPARAAMKWNRATALMPFAGRRFDSYLVYRYEDIVAEPRAVLPAMASRLGVEEPNFPFLDDRVVRLQLDHSLWGNPNRFQHGPVTIRRDDEWKRVMAPRHKRLVTALTLPLLLKHGYQIDGWRHDDQLVHAV